MEKSTIFLTHQEARCDPLPIFQSDTFLCLTRGRLGTVSGGRGTHRDCGQVRRDVQHPQVCHPVTSEDHQIYPHSCLQLSANRDSLDQLWTQRFLQLHLRL